MRVRTLIVTAVGLILTLASVPGAGAQTPSPTGLVAFEAGTGSGTNTTWEIHVYDPSTRATTNITNTPEAQEYDPVWSPDGSRIAFISDRTTSGNEDGNYEIFTMAADGSDVVQVTDTVAPEFGFVQSYEPDWSPDGTQIVFSGYRQFSSRELYKIPAAGGEEVLLTNPFDQSDKGQPDWSPNGARIVFTLGSYLYGDIHEIDAADGANDTNLTPETDDWGHRDPAYSPDGSAVAFTDSRNYNFSTFNEDIFIMSSQGRLDWEVQLTDDEHIDETPTWTADGSQIVFSSSRGGGYDLYLIDVPLLPSASGGVRSSARSGGTEPPVTPLVTASGDQTDPDEGSVGGGPGPIVCTKKGTAAAEVLRGTAGDDVLCGLGGADTIYGNGGDDLVIGAGGADVVYGGAGADELRGGLGPDDLYGGTGADVLKGGAGNDDLFGGTGQDTCLQGTGTGVHKGCE